MRKVHLFFSVLIFSFVFTFSYSNLSAMEKQPESDGLSWWVSWLDASYWVGSGRYSKECDKDLKAVRIIKKMIRDSKAIFYKSPLAWSVVFAAGSSIVVGVGIYRLRRSGKKKIEEHPLSESLERVHDNLKRNCKEIEIILLGFFRIEKKDLKKSIEEEKVKFSEKAMRKTYPLIGDTNIKNIVRDLKENKYKPLLIDNIKTYDDKIYFRLKALESQIGCLIKIEGTLFATKKYVKYEPSVWKVAVTSAYKRFLGSLGGNGTVSSVKNFLKGNKKLIEIRNKINPWGEDFKEKSDHAVINHETKKYRKHCKMSDENSSSSGGFKKTVKSMGKGAVKGAFKGIVRGLT